MGAGFQSLTAAREKGVTKVVSVVQTRQDSLTYALCLRPILRRCTMILYGLVEHKIWSRSSVLKRHANRGMGQTNRKFYQAVPPADLRNEYDGRLLHEVDCKVLCCSRPRLHTSSAAQYSKVRIWTRQDNHRGMIP